MMLATGFFVLLATLAAIAYIDPDSLLSSARIVTASVIAHGIGTAVMTLIQRPRAGGTRRVARVVLAMVLYVLVVLAGYRALFFLVPALFASGGGMIVALLISYALGAGITGRLQPEWTSRNAQVLALLALTSTIVCMYAAPRYLRRENAIRSDCILPPFEAARTACMTGRHDGALSGGPHAILSGHGK